jgi:tetraacyldisaccharide 4'-kinase
VLVAQDRASLGPIARERKVDVLLLDDGFQHRRLHRDLDVVLWDRTAERSGGRLLPGGPLREPPSALARADVLILVDRGDGFPPAPAAFDGGRVFRARLETFCTERVPDGAAVHALSGVADPVSFEAALAKLGLRVTGATRYADHHAFSREEILAAAARAREERADALAVTAKDHVRWPGAGSGELPAPLVFDANIVIEEEESFLTIVESTLEGFAP